MNKWFINVLSSVKKRPGLVLLIVILSIITVNSIKPDFYLIGWDNYSSYFNLLTNLFRTLFATWRDYRGLGVPSDAEVVDIFRQLFFLVLTSFVHQSLLDQLYYLFILNLGVLGMYAFSSIVYKQLEKKILINKQDLFATTAAFFYLFNLNTLAVFYFPMVMFVTRFAALPLTFLILQKFLSERIKKYTKLIFIAILFLTFGSCLVPTVFITMLLVLIIFFVFAKKTNGFVLLILFIGLNLFWVLPFVNYTLNKSTTLRLAPAYIDANEALLNKSKSFYSLDKQIILFPNFFEMKFTNQSDKRQLPFHPLANDINHFPYNAILLIFPILYLLGIVVFLIKYRNRYNLLWVPITLLTFLLLSLKEYSPVGFLYNFINQHLPLFGVIFRFGDTKFHPYIAFTGSLLVAVFVLYLSNQFYLKTIKKITGIVTIMAILLVYQSYFSGNLIGFFMYNRIPEAYSQIAKTINLDKGNYRILHLPMDENGYWKSYSWGMFGSAFLNFMFDRPLFDKTFDPASNTNADSNKKIVELLNNFQSIENQDQKQEKARIFYQLLKRLSIKYLLLDESAAIDVNSRGVDYWGTLNLVNSKKMVEELTKMRLIQTTESKTIDTLEAKDYYSKLYPYNQIHSISPASNAIKSLTLYKVVDIDERISFINKSENIDPQIKQSLLVENIPLDVHFTQESFNQDYKTRYYPFQRKDGISTIVNGKVEMLLPGQVSPGQYLLSNTQQNNPNETMLEFYFSRDSISFIIDCYQRIFPNINGNDNLVFVKQWKVPISVFSGLYQTGEAVYLNNWHILPQRNSSNLRIVVNNIIFPVPLNLTETPAYGASVMVDHSVINLGILKNNQTQLLDLKKFSSKSDPNCFADKINDYRFNLVKNQTSLEAEVQNGSYCLISEIPTINNDNYFELNAVVEGESKDNDQVLDPTLLGKPILGQIIQSFPKPVSFWFCLKEQNGGGCLNNHQLIKIKGQKQYVITPDKPIAGPTNLSIEMALKNVGYQQQKVKLSNLQLLSFRQIASTQFSIVNKSANTSFDIIEQSQLQMSYPLTLSSYSYYFNSDVDEFYVSTAPCEKNNGYRTFRLSNDNDISYVNNCSNTIFINLPFSSQHFYQWFNQYNLVSGQFPSLILDDGFFSYLNERMSLYQGYPDIAGFKTLQGPEFFTEKLAIIQQLNQQKMQYTYVYLYPHDEFNDNKEKKFQINHKSENEGVMLLRDINIIRLPTSWSNLVINPKEGKTESYDLPSHYSYKQLLPSLWRLDVDSITDRKMLLKFNESYDNQWGLYDSITNLLLGKEIVSAIKCDGYANCFNLSNLKQGKHLFYIFYFPEKLSLIGWLLTLLSIVILLRLDLSNNKNL